ncbi:hypothetical protein DL764_003564 [Monosporascus ibericus]|uniref:AB hydrolase-1 domain-containing protein n=1 Tax=Monosporascus ibericus TaxID=155417 RepID=A0A4Q4TG15_9PEZI|nr:hypothetical protein DL764_003564 [Monosporascus ibericus]
MKVFSLLCALAIGLLSATMVSAQSNGTIIDTPQGRDLNGSNFTYPWPLKLYRFLSQQQQVEMAFMNVAPTCSSPNGKVAVPAARSGSASRRSRVLTSFTLAQLSANTQSLLQTLKISRATVVGHSLGGMTSARYVLTFPDTIEVLVLVNPIGLQNWRALGVPYRDVDALYSSERASNYTSIRAYEQETYYLGEWSRAYDVWARMLTAIYAGSRGDAFAFDQALTTDMALSQPVVYGFPFLKPRTLLLIGEKDVTARGKQWSPPGGPGQAGPLGYPGQAGGGAIPNADLIEFPGLGHAPQMQAPERFHAELLGWLERNG